jgi:D-alanyl-D-alanine carboxypeptidase
LNSNRITTKLFITTIQKNIMKKTLFIGMLSATVLLGACKKEEVKLPVSKYVNAPLSNEYRSRLNSVLDSVCDVFDIKGASAAVLVPNVGVWRRAYGESYAGVPIDTNMIFTIGSNTKTYIATLMLKLQEEGRLNISDTIGKWIINKPYTNAKVTIKQLLNHTSGFGDFSFNPLFIVAIRSDFNRVWQPEEMYPFFEAPYFVPPGSSYRYSDQNLLLAGIIIEKVTGKPLKVSLRELVLAPSGLNKTVYYPFETTSLTIPHSWSADYSATGQLEDLDEQGYSRVAFCSADNAAGGMLSTAEENVRFWNALMSGKIINQNSLTLMKQFVPTDNPAEGYGLCLEQRINALNGRTVYAHNGYVPGSINDNAYDPKSGICISILTNQDRLSDFKPILEALHKVTLQFNK